MKVSGPDFFANRIRSLDTVKDFEQFHSFLCDCDERSNKLVQTLKKVDAEFLARNFAKVGVALEIFNATMLWLMHA